MDKSLQKKSGILWIKSKFFLYRVVSYFSFLLVPILVPKMLSLEPIFLVPFILLYILFMFSQWFLLGKEIDHRLKIYYRVNSSIDRVVYRIYMGMFFLVLLFNLLTFLPNKWIYNAFWAVWVLLGLFYSWPTRGKIIEESMTSNFGEFRYLDRFEKTLVFLILILFTVSIPEFPQFNTIGTLKLYFDPSEKLSFQFWNFLVVNYFPFKKYPDLLRLSWSLHFYIVGLGLFLLTLYALLRYYISRRLSLLGVFAFLSTWSISKILVIEYGAAVTSTFSLLWVWAILWVVKSSTYRSGLFLGLVGYWGTLIDQSQSVLMAVHLLFLYYLFLNEKTAWFRRQIIRYSLLGAVLVVFIFMSHSEHFESASFFDTEFIEMLKTYFKRKAFFALALFGVVIALLKYKGVKIQIIEGLKVDKERLSELFLCMGVLIAHSYLTGSSVFKYYSIIWMIVFFSLLPIEMLFQSISRLRSSRNMIYLIYILICLLDSHFEGRVKILLRSFQN